MQNSTQAQVNRLIGPLMKKLHAIKARKICVVSWDLENEARQVSLLLATGFSRQLEKKCAVIVLEGIRAQDSELPEYRLITLPEYAPDGVEGKVAVPEKLMKDCPLAFIAGPALSEESDPLKTQATRMADAHILVVPRKGLQRDLTARLQARAARLGLKWAGVIMIEEDAPQETLEESSYA